MADERRVVLPLHEWGRLPYRERREVARRARHQEQHPDPHVAAVARAWAAETLRQPPPQSVMGKLAFLLTLAPLGGSVLGDAALARRILAADRHNQ